jgi:microcystin-dependent protein
MASNTLTNTKISVTYAGVLHSAGIQLPATGLEHVYDGVGNRSSIRIGRDCSGMTVCGNLSATSISTSNSLSASQINTKTLLDVLHPVGTVLFTTTGGNPGTTRAGWNVTTWTQISQGRFIVGIGRGDDGTDTQTFALSTTGDPGRYKHQLTINEMPSHRHAFTAANGNTNDQSISPFQYTFDDAEETYNIGDVGNTGNKGILDTGGNARHNNIPPSFGLYIWRRTA